MMYAPGIQLNSSTSSQVVSVFERRLNGVMSAEHAGNATGNKVLMAAAMSGVRPMDVVAMKQATSKPIMQPPKKRRAVGLDCELQSTAAGLTSPCKVTSPVAFAFDLSEWRNHRVLARHGQVYLPGTITSAGLSGIVTVRFDASARNVAGKTAEYDCCSRSTDVVSDCAPTAPSVCVGSGVCVRVDADSTEFHTGVVRDKRVGPPVQFRVEVDCLTGSVWVYRAQLRLLQAPWFEDEEEAEVARITSNALDSAAAAHDGGTRLPSTARSGGTTTPTG